MVRIDTKFRSPEIGIETLNSDENVLRASGRGGHARVEDFGGSVALNNIDSLITSRKVENTLDKVVVFETDGLEVNVGVTNNRTCLGAEGNNTSDIKTRENERIGVILAVKSVLADIVKVADVIGSSGGIGRIDIVLAPVVILGGRGSTPGECDINGLRREVRRSHANQELIVENGSSGGNGAKRARQGLIVFKSETMEDDGLDKARGGPVLDSIVNIGCPMPERGQGIASVDKVIEARGVFRRKHLGPAINVRIKKDVNATP